MGNKEVKNRILDLLARMFNQENYLRIADNSKSRSMKQSTSLPYIHWNENLIKQEIGISNLPEELLMLWSYCSSLIIHFEKDRGLDIQGIYIYSPDQALVRHKYYYIEELESAKAEKDICEGDFIIGEYISEHQYILIRCDDQSKDFGSIMMTQPIDPREEWPIVGTSLLDFLEAYYSAGEKFWDSEKYWRS
jgi:hypothetical protein